MANVVELVEVSKIFKDFWGRPKVKAVQDINFEIKEGEVFGLLGPNGSGKSTTIKMILGLLKTSQGRISVLGRSTKSIKNKDKIGYLPEDSYLYNFLNADETLQFFGGLFGLKKSERKRRADDLIKMVGLENARNRKLGEYSKGMARRIGLAQALVGDPQFLILDEPTTGLDPIGTKEIKDLILELKSRGKTILLTSHLLADVQDICDRVCILYGGKISATGTLEELLQKRECTTIATDTLDDELKEKIRLLFEEHQKNAEFSHPLENLEEYFLRIVEKARGELDTSGALRGQSAPNFLHREASSIVDQLVEKEEKGLVDETPLNSQMSESNEVEKENKLLIDSLLQTDNESVTPVSIADSTALEEKSKSNNVIDQLLGMKNKENETEDKKSED